MRNVALFILLSFSVYSQTLVAQELAPFDILVTEIMVDPTPTVGLPNFEWVEIYNRSNQDIDLEDFQFSSGSAPRRLPSFILVPGAFALIADDSNEAELSIFGSTICVSSFPSLTNTGDVATIWDKDGMILHEVNYTRAWYGDSSKDDGGYTIEMINPEDHCLGVSNWGASMNSIGGTPGMINSIWLPATPNTDVQLLNAKSEDANTIRITFDRIPSEDLNEMDFAISNGRSIIDIMEVDEDPFSYYLFLDIPLEAGVPYRLTMMDSVKDCSGDANETDQFVDIILPKPLQVGDIIINEILFNPVGSESDYVELFNVTHDYLEIGGLSIGNLKEDGSGTTKDIDFNFILEPMDFVVLTEDPNGLLNRYTSAISTKVIEVDLPSFNNTSGNVSLLEISPGGILTLDAMNYDEGMHNDFIDNLDGIALERLDVFSSSEDRMNWHSASSISGYGTPTLRNSQEITNAMSGVGIKLKSKTFYPQGHPSDERLEIIFELDKPDYLTSIDIYDGAGRLVKNLARNQLLGRNDTYYWDGLDGEMKLTNAGVYIIFVRIINSSGALITKKLPCVLSRTT